MPKVGRVCGPCTLCCTVLRVDELAKPARVACGKLRPAGSATGCSIHDRRPRICRAYECAWLRGSFGEEDRPDRLGAVVDLAFRGNRLWLEIHEERPGAFESSQRLQEIAQEYRASAYVRISDADQVAHPDRPFRILLPGGFEQRVRGTRIELHQDGVLVDSSEMGPLHRLVARMWRAWRRRRFTGRLPGP